MLIEKTVTLFGGPRPFCVKKEALPHGQGAAEAASGADGTGEVFHCKEDFACGGGGGRLSRLSQCVGPSGPSEGFGAKEGRGAFRASAAEGRGRQRARSRKKGAKKDRSPGLFTFVLLPCGLPFFAAPADNRRSSSASRRRDWGARSREAPSAFRWRRGAPLRRGGNARR